jgi:SpoVK/Ycf46/Vps4 family AAA+-type ATPase
MNRELSPYESDLEYLEDELEWIELRCKRIIIGQLVDSESDDGEGDLFYRQQHYGAHQPLDALTARHRQLREREKNQRDGIDRRLYATREAGEQLAIDELVEMYGLSDFERTILLLSASVTFSRRFMQLFGRIWNGYEALVVETVFSFCELPFSARIEHLKALSKAGPLVSNELISLNLGGRINSPQELLEAQIRISNRTFDFLVGDDHFMDEFMEFSSVEEPRARFEQVVLDPRDKERILSVVECHDDYLQSRKDWGFDDVITYGKGVLMLFYGKPGTGKTMSAHAVAEQMDMRVLNVDIPTFINHYDAQRFLPALFREAKMQNAILFFDECEALFSSRHQGNTLMTLLLTELESFEGVAILATNLPQQLDEALDRRILVKISFPEPDRVARREIWDKHLPEAAPVAADVDLDVLADRYEMTGGYIKNAVLMAVADAVYQGGDQPEITMAALEQAAREQITPANEENSPVERAQTTMDDVVLSESLRRRFDELVEAARGRRTVLERWKLGEHLSYGKNVAALLVGPAGTGKTMCAEAVAHRLNRPLLVHTLSGLTEHWQGPLQQAFEDARSHNAVLLLDDAGEVLASDDGELRAAIFSRMERYEGVVLVASRQAPPAESAVSGLFTYEIQLPFPDELTRAEIWRAYLPDTVPTEGFIDHDSLGATYKLSGREIKQAAFKATFRAAEEGGAVTMELLRKAAGRV